MTDRDAILKLVKAFNEAKAGPTGFENLAILLQVPRSRKTAGGLWASILYDWLNIELMFVPQSFRGRGLGTQLLNQVEQLALTHGCVGVWLDTFGFQARGFYEKNGYEIFGTLDDHPRGSQRYFMRKRLIADAGSTK